MHAMSTAESSTARIAGRGNFVTWDRGCFFIGAGGIVPVHAHYAIQIAFGSERGIRFRTSESEPWTEYEGAVIPSRQPHSMDVTGVPYCLTLFVEPETREGRALRERYRLDDPTPGIAAISAETLAECRPAVFAAWREERTWEAVTGAAQRVVQALTGDLEPSIVSDERILRAIAYINANLGTPLTLDEVAREAYLSPSRFRHLFVEETGMGLRPYILWRRFLRVWELVPQGVSLSAAAHAAGFADAAHLTRTSHRMFGFAPSGMHLAEPLRKSAPTYK
jgi:AraC family transcriptional regulator